MSDYQKAILAGGCFWGMQDLIRKQPGVVVDPRRLHRRPERPRDLPQPPRATPRPSRSSTTRRRPTTATSLEFFFQIHDPTTKNRQGNDVGTSYRSAIFYTDDEQKRVALDTIADVDASGLWPGKVVTEVTPAVRLLGGRAGASGLPGALSRTATPATSRGRAGSCPSARSSDAVRVQVSGPPIGGHECLLCIHRLPDRPPGPGAAQLSHRRNTPAGHNEKPARTGEFT